jgi:hypothetical protein
MAISGGGPLSATNLKTEFGGSDPFQISDYYKGGGLVPSLSPGNVPVSGTIKFSDFYNSTSILDPPFAIGANMFNKVFTGTCQPIVTTLAPGEPPGGDTITTPRDPTYINCGVGTSPASGAGNVYDSTYVFNPLHNDATYQVDWSMTAAEEYNFTYGIIYIYVNGILTYNGHLGDSPTLPGWNDSYFRSTTGKRSISSPSLTLGFGDTVRAVMFVSTRGGVDSNKVNHTEFSMRLYRTA